jgi:hypothetical protein
VKHFCSQALCVVLFVVLRISDTFIRDADISKVLNQILLQFSTGMNQKFFKISTEGFYWFPRSTCNRTFFLIHRQESTGTLFPHFILFWKSEWIRVWHISKMYREITSRWSIVLKLFCSFLNLDPKDRLSVHPLDPNFDINSEWESWYNRLNLNVKRSFVRSE